MIEAIGSLLPGGMEWLVILFVLLLLFGAKLPSVMRNLGGSVKEFKKGMEEGAEVDKTAPKVKDSDPTQVPPASQTDSKAPSDQGRKPS
jgi:sec-independent protein translocase protein TatA